MALVKISLYCILKSNNYGFAFVLNQEKCWLASSNVEINHISYKVKRYSFNAKFFNELFIIPISVSFFHKNAFLSFHICFLRLIFCMFFIITALPLNKKQTQILLAKLMLFFLFRRCLS